MALLLAVLSATSASRLVAQRPDTMGRICQPTAPPKCVPALPRDSQPGGPPRGEPEYGQPWFEFMVDQPVREAPETPHPVYPAELKAAGVGGEVLAQFVVDTTGHVEPLTIKTLRTSHARFTAAIVKALPNMRFIPAEARGRKVRQVVMMPFIFDPKKP